MGHSTDRFRILIPCDYSLACKQALEACATLDWRMPVEVFILTVEDPMQAGAREMMDERLLAEWVKVFSPDINVRNLQAKGRFVNVVLEALAIHGIDLVIAGTRGARGWEGVFLGSHAERIVRVSPVPVLAISQRPHLTGLRDIVLPIDIDRDPVELRACMRKIPGLFNGRFHLLHVQTNPAGSERAAMKLLGEYSRHLRLGHCTSSVIFNESVAGGILRYATQAGADLIALGTLGSPDPAHMFRPSVAADIVNHAKIPVLTFQLSHRQVSVSF
ncbi:universal stress protein [Dyadobacter sp. 22481]|uniref:universal stress protein n=1 Tax=Dyadobacter sp. 22481 TaxID=3453926 RepID=UPI003F8433A9